MPLLRMARMRPATRTRSPVSAPAGQPGIAPLELGRLVGAGEGVGVGVDPERPEPVELGQPDGAQRIFCVVHRRLLPR